MSELPLRGALFLMCCFSATKIRIIFFMCKKNRRNRTGTVEMTLKASSFSTCAQLCRFACKDPVRLRLHVDLKELDGALGLDGFCNGRDEHGLAFLEGDCGAVVVGQTAGAFKADKDHEGIETAIVDGHRVVQIVDGGGEGCCRQVLSWRYADFSKDKAVAHDRTMGIAESSLTGHENLRVETVGELDVQGESGAEAAVAVVS